MNFYFRSTWSSRPLFSPSLLFSFEWRPVCLRAPHAGSCAQISALIAGVAHFRRVGLFITACLCSDSGRPLVFKHPLIHIQRLVFPPRRAGSHWGGANAAHYANEASFMDAEKNGSLQKSLQTSNLFLSHWKPNLMMLAWLIHLWNDKCGSLQLGNSFNSVLMRFMSLFQSGEKHKETEGSSTTGSFWILYD